MNTFRHKTSTLSNMSSRSKKRSKRVRDTINNANLEESVNKKLKASKNAHRVKVWRNSNKQRGEEILTPAKLKKMKECAKDSRGRRNARNNNSFIVREECTDIGDYYIIDTIPWYDMSQLLINFKSFEFRNDFSTQSSEIVSCNPNLEKENRSTFWLLDKSKGTDIFLSGHWHDQKMTSSSQDIILDNILYKIVDGLNDVLDERVSYLIKKPGFLETTTPTHQDLHLDSKGIVILLL